MISKNIVKQPKSIVDIEITVPWADLEGAWNANIQKLASEVEVSGFRKGQAPLAMVEQQLGNKIHDEFFKNYLPQALIQSLTGTDVVPIDYPKYQVVSFAKGQPLVFKAQVTQRPIVSVGNYKGLMVKRPVLKTITEEEVNKIINDMFNRWKSRAQAAPAPTATAAASEPVNGGGGSLSFNQSKPAASPIATDVPNDDFAKAMGAQSLADLKVKLRADLEAESKYNNELDYEEAILQEVEKVTQVELPNILIEDELNRMLVSLQRRVADMGLLLEDYLKTQNKTLEQLKQEWRIQAEKNVRMELGLAEIAHRENIQITEEQLQAEIDKIQDNKLKAQFEAQEPKLHLRHSLRQIKTLEFLKTLTKVI